MGTNHRIHFGFLFHVNISIHSIPPTNASILMYLIDTFNIIYIYGMILNE